MFGIEPFLTIFMAGRFLPHRILNLVLFFYQALIYHVQRLYETVMVLLLDVMQNGYGLVVLNASLIRVKSLYKSYHSILALFESYLELLLQDEGSTVTSHHCRRHQTLSLPALPYTWVEATHHALTLKNSVELCPDGVGGTYFIRGQDNYNIAVFKPIDEEPGALLNPKQLLKNPLMPPGGGAIREVAAYVLDYKHSAGVPETRIVPNLRHEHFNNQDKSKFTPKTGSLQKYINNIGYSDSMGSSGFSLDDVHNIGILDIRILNLDRNGENILIVKDDSQIRLVPIDHAYSLPESLDEDFYFEWFYWRQAKIQFSEKTLQLIEEIDIERDSILLEKLGISKKAIGYMRLASILLKKGAMAGRMTLFQIASWYIPKRRNEVSQFKKLVERTNELGKLRQQLDMDRIFEQLVDELISSCQS